MHIILKLNPVYVGKKTVECRRIPRSTNGGGMHWAAAGRWKHAWQDMVGQHVNLIRKSFGPLPLKFATITTFFHSIREIDEDNMKNAAKPLIDILKVSLGNTKIGPNKWMPKPGLGIIIDDKREFLKTYTEWVPTHKIVEEHIEMRIEF